MNTQNKQDSNAVVVIGLHRALRDAYNHPHVTKEKMVEALTEEMSAVDTALLVEKLMENEDVHRAYVQLDRNNRAKQA